mmetsp:Transcript_118366/g.166352  ORF Transcript_118366/g.166352 Transcript_118366/m.166352 type:complete len:290 (+) Transcript_118366:440-1309(+)
MQKLESDHGWNADQARRPEGCLLRLPPHTLAHSTGDGANHLQLAQRVLRRSDDIIPVASPRPEDLLDDLLAFLPEGLQWELVFTDTVLRMLHAGIVHGVDLRNVLARNHLGQCPAERSIGARKVHAAVKLVHLVEDDDKLVVQPSHGSRQHIQRLTRCTGPVRIKEQQDQICTFRKPAHDFQEVVASTTGHALGLHRHVDHSGSIHDLQPIRHDVVLREHQLPPAEVAPEGLAKALKLLERPVLWAAEQRGAVFHLVACWVPLQDGKAVVCRCDTCLLHARAKESIDEG